MANLSKWTIFFRAFIIALIAAQPARVGSQTSSEEQAWRKAQEANTAQAYHGFLSRYPAGKFVRDAIGALQSIGAVPSSPLTRNLGQTGSGTKDAGTSSALY